MPDLLALSLGGASPPEKNSETKLQLI